MEEKVSKTKLFLARLVIVLMVAFVVLGLAMPVTFEDQDTRAAFLGYLSYELPFEHR